MKKVIILLFVILVVTGCGKKETINYEKIMEGYVKDYYETYMRGVLGQTNNVVSINALNEANTNREKKYDLDKLKDCDEASYTIVVVDEETRDIKKYEHYLNCK